MHSPRSTVSQARFPRAFRGSAIPAALLLGCAGLLWGCAGPDQGVCPAIGYMSTATITLESPRPGVTLEVCDGEGCLIDQPAEQAEIRAKEPTREAGMVTLSGTSMDGWQAAFLLGGEETIGYRLSDDAGAVIGEGHLGLDWKRIDGTEQCGGNRAASAEIPM